MFLGWGIGNFHTSVKRPILTEVSALMRYNSMCIAHLKVSAWFASDGQFLGHN